MPTVEELKKNAPSDDGVIVDPNLARARERAQAGSSGLKAIDPTKEFGYKTEAQHMAEIRESQKPKNVIQTALDVEIEMATKRKAEEMQRFSDVIDQCDGEATDEDMASSGIPDYKAMLSNPPDPLNRDLKKFTEERIKKFKETATPEELAAMGLADKSSVSKKENEKVEEDDIDNDEVIEETDEVEIDTAEDEELLKEMDDVCDDIQVTETPVDLIANAIEKADNEEEDKHHFDDKIPVYKPAVSAEDVAKINTNPVEIPDNIPDTEDIDLDKEMELLIGSDEEDEEPEVDRKTILQEKYKNARKDIQNKVIPIANRINIQGFTISNRPVSINNSIDMATKTHKKKRAVWVLMSTGVPIVMEEFLGEEVDNLVKYANEANNEGSAHSIKKLYTLIYDHVVSPKPDTVDDWMKVVSVMDIKNIYAAIYKASFDGLNFMPYDCTDTKCNNGFISDNIPFMDMVKFKDDEAKNKFDKILNSVPDIKKFKRYTTEVVPVSDVYAMSFREPSIYDAVLNPSYIESEWYDKMEGTIALATYVDKIFVIDAANKTLRPLNVKEFKNDPRKTLKAKVLALAKVIKTLSSDQYTLMSAYIEEINKNGSSIDYQKPEIFCPKCGTKINAEDDSPINLLFTRHRLTSLVSGSTE